MYVFIDFNPAFQEFHHKMTFLAFYFSQLVLPRSRAIIFIFPFITPKACKPNIVLNRAVLDTASALKTVLCVFTLQMQLPYASFLLHIQEGNN